MPPLPPHHGLNECQAREIAATNDLQEDTVVFRPNGAHLHRMLHRVLRAVHTVVTPGHVIPPNPEHKCTEVAMSGDDLRQTKREDTVVFLQLLLKEGHYRRNDDYDDC